MGAGALSRGGGTVKMKFVDRFVSKPRQALQRNARLGTTPPRVLRGGSSGT